MKQRKFTLQDQFEFAKLSGDYNPIHIDPVSARRYMFGQPIVHGVHSILWALEIWCKKNKNAFKILSLKAFFYRPINLDIKTEYKVISNSQNHFEIELLTESVVNTKLVVEMGEISKENNHKKNIPPIIDAFPENHIPRNLTKDEILGMSGNIDLYLKKSAADLLFPNLVQNIDSFQIATILSTTRLVGMYCPGLNSLYSALDLSFDNPQVLFSPLKYEVNKIDNRFGLVYLRLEGDGITGTIKSFLRPSSVAQSDFVSLQNFVTPGEFSGQRALIIGGSRGLGEVAAKLLTAGGASIRITYNQGKQDANIIVNEITTNGGQAEAIPFNVLDIQSINSCNISENWFPTHCYYFATPFIFSGIKGIYSEKLFNKFCTYYITGFYNTIILWHAKGLNNFFYPSTIAVNEFPDNMVEYALSKAAGEKLCEFMVSRSTKLNIYKPRFPRMATDQTVSFSLVKNEDPILLTLKHLRAFHSLSKS
jgi:hypothetical protein